MYVCTHFILLTSDSLQNPSLGVAPATAAAVVTLFSVLVVPPAGDGAGGGRGSDALVG